MPTAKEYAAQFGVTMKSIYAAGLSRLDACKDDTFRRLLCQSAGPSKRTLAKQAVAA